jgi:HEAT repeat protein
MYLHHSNINPPKAKKYLLSVAKTDTYLKPYAEVALNRVHEEEDRIRKKIPVLLNELKNGDLEKRDNAARGLIFQAGPEGIKVLEEAQQDPNKYVRYAAACNLAQWGRDSANKANFDIILEAFTDENPQIRNKARAAFGSYNGLKVGPEEIAALVKQMGEHYTTETMWTVQSLLSSSETSSDIKERGVSELTKLLSHEDPEVRDGALEIFRRMRYSAAGAIPVLVERLDKEDIQTIQVKIIGILSRLGPDAKQAVPILKKYLEHDDAKLRRYAGDALRRISPAEADKILGTR